jgi:hypothetical protein
VSITGLETTAAPGTKKMHEQFRAPCPHQAADAEHLTGPQFERDAVQLRAELSSFSATVRNRPSEGLAGLGGTSREEIADLATDHVADDLGFARVSGSCVPTVCHHAAR